MLIHVYDFKIKILHGIFFLSAVCPVASPCNDYTYFHSYTISVVASLTSKTVLISWSIWVQLWVKRVCARTHECVCVCTSVSVLQMYQVLVGLPNPNVKMYFWGSESVCQMYPLANYCNSLYLFSKADTVGYFCEQLGVGDLYHQNK